MIAKMLAVSSRGWRVRSVRTSAITVGKPYPTAIQPLVRASVRWRPCGPAAVSTMPSTAKKMIATGIEAMSAGSQLRNPVDLSTMDPPMRQATRGPYSAPSGKRGPQQVDGPGDAPQLDVADLREHDPLPLRRVGHGAADQHLALPRVVGDPRGQVHGLAEVVALLEQDRPRGEADVRRRQPLGSERIHHLQGRADTRTRIGEVEHHAVAEPLDPLAPVLHRAAPHQPRDRRREIGGGLVAELLCQPRV